MQVALIFVLFVACLFMVQASVMEPTALSINNSYIPARRLLDERTYTQRAIDFFRNIAARIKAVYAALVQHPENALAIEEEFFESSSSGDENVTATKVEENDESRMHFGESSEFLAQEVDLVQSSSDSSSIESSRASRIKDEVKSNLRKAGKRFKRRVKDSFSRIQN